MWKKHGSKKLTWTFTDEKGYRIVRGQFFSYSSHNIHLDTQSNNFVRYIYAISWVIYSDIYNPLWLLEKTDIYEVRLSSCSLPSTLPALTNSTTNSSIIQSSLCRLPDAYQRKYSNEKPLSSIWTFCDMVTDRWWHYDVTCDIWSEWCHCTYNCSTCISHRPVERKAVKSVK